MKNPGETLSLLGRQVATRATAYGLIATGFKTIEHGQTVLRLVSENTVPNSASFFGFCTIALGAVAIGTGIFLRKNAKNGARPSL